MDTAVVEVTTTLPTEADAAALADALVTARLAACAQVTGPVRSRYRWEGAVEDATEWRCVAKTTAAAAERVVDAIIDQHPYDVPEVLVLPVVGGNGAFLAWVRRAVDG